MSKKSYGYDQQDMDTFALNVPKKRRWWDNYFLLILLAISILLVFFVSPGFPRTFRPADMATSGIIVCHARLVFSGEHLIIKYDTGKAESFSREDVDKADPAVFKKQESLGKQECVVEFFYSTVSDKKIVATRIITVKKKHFQFVLMSVATLP